MVISCFGTHSPRNSPLSLLSTRIFRANLFFPMRVDVTSQNGWSEILCSLCTSFLFLSLFALLYLVVCLFIYTSICFIKCKGKVRPRTGQEGPEGERRYSSTLSLTSALDGVGGQRHALAALLPRMPRYPSCRRLGDLQGRCGRVCKISPSNGIRSLHRPACSESLYRLSYLFYTLYFYFYLHLTSFLISLLRKRARARHSEIIQNKAPFSLTQIY